MPPFILNHMEDQDGWISRRDLSASPQFTSRGRASSISQSSYTIENICVVLAGITAQIILYYLTFSLWVFTACVIVVTSCMAAYSKSLWEFLHEIILLLMFFETVPVVLLGVPLVYGGSWIMNLF